MRNWIAAALMFAASIRTAAADGAPQGQLPHDVTPTHYSLTLTIDPHLSSFSGHDEIAVVFNHPASAIWINGKSLTVTSAAVRLANGQTIRTQYHEVDPSGVARLSFAGTVPAGRATLLFDYKAPFAPGLAGLYKVTRGNDAYAFTQFESIAARRMFPSFDEPGYKTAFAITVNAPKGDAVIANTLPTSHNETGGGLVHWVFGETKKLPTYLVALAVGPLDVVDFGTIPRNAYRKTPLPLRGVAVRGEGRQLHYALSLTPKIVEALENYYRIGFPFEKLDMIAVPDFAAGAMENAGAITFREQLLLMSPHAPLQQRRASLSVQAHELAHQWFGDLVTPKWWDDTWLNESFATWMAGKISAQVMPQGEFARTTLNENLGVMADDELDSARQIHNPVNNTGDIENSFDNITYRKGAAVLAMFESYSGDVAWRAGIHDYLTKFGRANASAKDFIGTMAQSMHKPEIVSAFDSYIDQPGIPDMSVVMRCSENPALTVVQAMYAPIGRMVPDRLWQVPMCVSAPGMEPACRIVGRTADISLGATCPAFAMPNALGKGYYRFAYDAKGWEQMVKAAPALDPADQLTLFANMRAGLAADQMAAKPLFTVIKALAPVAKWDLIDAMGETLHGYRLHLLKPEDLTVYRNFVRNEFGPRLRTLGVRPRGADTPEVQLTRAALAKILVEEAHDPATLSELSKSSHDYVSTGGRNFGALPPDLVREAMRAGVIDGGPAYGKTLLDAFDASNDDYFHRGVLFALAGAEDTAFLDDVFAMALTPKLRIGDVRFLFADMSQEPPARAALWDWYRSHYEALERRISAGEVWRGAAVMNQACTPELRKQLDDFFAPKLASLPPLKRGLTLAEERIDRCIALREAKGKDIRGTLIEASKSP